MPEPTLDALLARMSPADLTLVEGFRREPIPRLEVHRPALGKPPMYPDDDSILAVASDVALSLDRPNLFLDRPQSVADFIWQILEARSTARIRPPRLDPSPAEDGRALHAPQP